MEKQRKLFFFPRRLVSQFRTGYPAFSKPGIPSEYAELFGVRLLWYDCYAPQTVFRIV